MSIDLIAETLCLCSLDGSIEHLMGHATRPEELTSLYFHCCDNTCTVETLKDLNLLASLADYKLSHPELEDSLVVLYCATNRRPIIDGVVAHRTRDGRWSWKETGIKIPIKTYYTEIVPDDIQLLKFLCSFKSRDSESIYYGFGCEDLLGYKFSREEGELGQKLRISLPDFELYAMKEVN